MYYNLSYIFITLLCCFGSQLSAQTDETIELRHRLAFYNLENLFDTVDEPNKIDEAFLPDGDKKWTTERYQNKLDHIAEVVVALEFPAVLGVCEVENAAVLRDLSQHTTLQDHAYEVIHFESPDARGIDVGLLVQTAHFSVRQQRYIRVDFPQWLEPNGYTSRDILQVELALADSSSLHVFVNHWPSRRGGTAASEHRRLWVASHLRRAVDAVLLADPLAKVILMGDFNDEPQNNSISYALGTLQTSDATPLPGLLYNPFLALKEKGEGSYNYRGKWNMLDQMIHAGFTTPNTWQIGKHGVFRPDFLLYEGRAPSKTYGGNNYYGGYSDHLPIYLEIYRPMK